MRRMRFALAFALGVWLPALVEPSAFAQANPDAAGELQNVEAEAEKNKAEAERLKAEAERLAAEIAELQKTLVASAAAIRAAENEVAALESALSELALRQTEMRNRLASERDLLNDSLMALAGLSARPQAALLLERSPIDNARSRLLLAAVTPILDRRAHYFADILANLAVNAAETEAKRARLATRLLELAAENRRLSGLLEKKAGLADAARKAQDAKSQELAKLARQAKDLKDLLARLEEAAAASAAEEAKAEAAKTETAAAAPDLPPESQAAASALTARPKDLRPFPATGEGIVLPVRGRIVRQFGEAGGDVTVAKGIEIATANDAPVLAPFAGQIVFEGPFRSYGKILIIEHAGGYHTILAGLGEVAVGLGQWLLTGEPVGRMTRPDGEAPHLYLELRRNGEPIDPTPILAPKAE